MATTTPNYAVDYEDKRLTSIKSEEQTQLEQNAQMYDGMIQGVDTQYQGIADTIQSNADKLAQTQQENTDFQVQQIEQQKQQAQKDYTKEQSGAYADWQKQSNQYGVNAEQMAMQGLSGSGYSESSKVAMFNQYQNRVAVARETLSKVIMNYDNNIQQAILQNNSTIAQIQSEASLKQAEILLEGFQYKNSLVLEKANKEMELKQFYSNEYTKVLDQMNTENAMAENVRQFNEQQALDREKMQKDYEMQLAELTEKKRQFDEEMARLKRLDDEEAKRKAEELRIASQQAQAQINKLNAEAKAYTVTEDTIQDKPSGLPASYKDAKMSSKALPSSVLKSYGLDGNEKIYSNGGKYYAVDSDGVAVDITKDFTFSNGYQPKYVNGQALSSVGTIKSNGLSGNNVVSFLSTDKQASQNVWKAGNSYYVWDGKTKSYKNVTDAYLNAQKKSKTSTSTQNAVMNNFKNSGYDRYLY